MPASKVFIARHGERIDHVDRTWRATAERSHDPFLTRIGILQAAALGKRLMSENITQIYVSPFLRTLQTAHHANRAMGSHAKLFIETGMTEFLTPQWFPTAPTFLSPVELRAHEISVEEYTPLVNALYPETREMLIERVGACSRGLAERTDGNILLIGHGISCEFAARGLCDVGRREYIQYCGLQTCTRENGVWTVGDVEHDFMTGEIRPSRVSYR